MVNKLISNFFNMLVGIVINNSHFFVCQSGVTLGYFALGKRFVELSCMKDRIVVS